MSSLRLIALVLLLATGSLVTAAGSPAAAAQASAAPLDLTGFRMLSPVLFVNENAGSAVITIERSNTSVEAEVRYNTTGLSARPWVDYVPVKAMINFVPGQSSATFRVPIVDHGVSTLPKTIAVSLFGPYPIGLGPPSSALLTILGDDPAMVTNPANPLGLPSSPANGNPLDGSALFVDHQWGAAALARAAAHNDPASAGPLDVIAREPGTQRFGGWDGSDPAQNVSAYLARASVEEPGTVPMIATYRILPGQCAQGSDGGSKQDSYRHWITSFAHGIGGYRAVLFLEMDSLITTPCLSPHGVEVRMRELRGAIAVLRADCPRLVIYLDAGAADALPARRTAALLRRAGVAQIQGFFLNSTHFDWTSREIRYGEVISRLTGGKHFVVNTGENGQGPLVPRDRRRHGNEVLCNPPGRGLGPLPSTSTGYANVDAFAWTSNPGESGGACVPGAPKTGVYWPAYAIMLVRHADFAVR